MQAALRRHDAILHQAIEANGGQVFRTAGDAFCASFVTAPTAVAAAVEAQRTLSSESWQLETPLRVRVALHTGEAEAHAGDYIGSSLNRIGRLLPLCYGGQTLLTLATEELARDHLPGGVAMLDLGSHRFRDLTHPERIFQLVIDGLPDSFPPLKSLDAIPNNLSLQLTSFIGRERELIKVKEILSASRLLTLTGPGGTGKTRLALQAAADVLSDGTFADGVWLVELAPITEPSLVYYAIAEIWNVREGTGRPLRAALTDALHDKNLLLLLDNCEHLIETCAQIADDLLTACPGLKILASSREPLGIAGEMVYRVPSLSLPDPLLVTSLDELERSEAVRLFIERASAIQPGFALTEQNAAAVAKISRRLDGIPLAIELAAARVGLFSPEQIASRLDDRFRLLTGGSRTALPRQQTLRALIDWSYDLLSEAERSLFQRLSVFSAGWTFEAAEAVCGEEVLDLLAQLVNKSLVIVEEDPGEKSAHYRFLETIRQYARDHLLEAGEVETLRDKHLEFFAGFAREADRQLIGPEQRLWARRLEREHENLRAALEWALDRRPLQALEIAGNLALFWSRHGYATEGRRWLQEAIQRCEVLSAGQGLDPLSYASARAKAITGMGVLFFVQGDFRQAASLLEEGVHLWREVGDMYGLSFSLALLSQVNSMRGAVEEVLPHAQEALTIARELEDDFVIGMALNLLGQGLMRRNGDFNTARTYLEESLTRLRSAGNDWFAGIAILGLGSLAFSRGDYEASRERIQESKVIFQEMGDRHFVNMARSALADLARREMDVPQAVQLYGETIAEWRQMGNQGAVARCLECLAFIAGEQVKGSAPAVRASLTCRAGILFGAAEAIRISSKSPMTLYEQVEYDQQLSAIRQDVEERDFQSAWSQGRVMSIDQAITYAREGRDT